MRSVAAAGAPSVEEKDSWQVAAIVDWRYSDNEHAAAALFGGDKRPDMFELLWEQTGSSSHRERTWQSVSDLTGGYASQMLQEFLQKEYFSPPVQAAAAGTSKRKGGAPKAPSSKRAKLPAVVAPEAPTAETAEQQLPAVVQQLSAAAPKTLLRSSSIRDATSARAKIEEAVRVAVEDPAMSDEHKLFFTKLVDLLYAPDDSSDLAQASPVIAATAPATDGIAAVAQRTESVAGQKHRTLDRRVSRAVSTATQAMQVLEATSQASYSMEFDGTADYRTVTLNSPINNYF
jgi:hypothetical protein